MGLGASIRVKLRGVPILIGMTAILVPETALAQQVSQDVEILARITRKCDAFALPMMFGMLPGGAFIVDRSSVIHVTCTPSTTFTIALDDGENFGAGRRRMSRMTGSGRRFLSYELYKNAARTQRWGSSPVQSLTQTAPANGSAIALPVFGRTWGTAGAGPYKDVVTITLTF